MSGIPSQCHLRLLKSFQAGIKLNRMISYTEILLTFSIKFPIKYLIFFQNLTEISHSATPYKVFAINFKSFAISARFFPIFMSLRKFIKAKGQKAKKIGNRKSNFPQENNFTKVVFVDVVVICLPSRCLNQLFKTRSFKSLRYPIISQMNINADKIPKNRIKKKSLANVFFWEREFVQLSWINWWELS